MITPNVNIELAPKTIFMSFTILGDTKELPGAVFHNYGIHGLPLLEAKRPMGRSKRSSYPGHDKAIISLLDCFLSQHVSDICQIIRLLSIGGC